MKSRLRHAGRRAFTLVEAIVGAAVSSIVLATLVTGGMALFRSYHASEKYSAAQADQVRVLDYITRDVRRALTAVVTAAPAKLTVTVPDQYAAADPDRTFRTPTMTTEGTTLKASYGTKPVSISYYLSGSNLMRDENGVVTIIAGSVFEFQPAIDAADTKNKTVLSTLTFSPKFQRTAGAEVRAATALTIRAVMRNN